MTSIKLVIVGPGIMPIPPTGWGAVESLIWDYKLFLDKYHPEIQTTIVNTPNIQNIIQEVNKLNPDIVHIQYDVHANITSQLVCKKVILTSHYGYLHKDRLNTDAYFYTQYRQFVSSSALIACLSPEIADLYKSSGVDPLRLLVMPNGANDELFRYSESAKFTDRSIYLAKITDRKRQYLYQHIPDLFYAGNCDDNRFNLRNPRYLGEWSKTYLYDNLTDYANLVLLSDGEAHPLVCCEALVCGLGLVISEYAAANLDVSKPFIDIIPTSKLHDIEYVSSVIDANRKKSVSMRAEIREYGLANFSWKVVVDRYTTLLKSLIQ